MTKHIVVVSDRQKNNISVYTEEPAVVVTADRDMNGLRTLPEANHAGIYVLISENKRYVGQASGSVYDRLVQHDKSKDWWTKVIFFGRVDGRLDKSQTDYLEELLIQQFESTSFQLENKTLGNMSYIDRASKIHADNVWYHVQEILEEVANIDIFESLSEHEEEQTHVVGKKEFVIKDSNGHTFKSKSARANYIDFIRHYFQSEQYKETISRLIIDGKHRNYATIYNIH